MKKEILDLINCPDCHSAFLEKEGKELICSKCEYTVKIFEGKPLFTDVPPTIEPWGKIERGPDKGTAWRKSNWKFLNQIVSELPDGVKILDVGAGHGDFADIYIGRNSFSLDIVPYPEVDLVADLGVVNPFKENVFEAVVLMNVLEHVYESRNLIKSITRIITPGGIVVFTVPFLLKVHQAPFDYSRYTPYFIENMATEAGLLVERLQGHYDPQYLLNESLGNVWQYSIKSQPKLQRLMAKIMVALTQHMINDLGRLTRKGFVADYKSQPNPAPVGYLVVLRKRE